MPTDTKEKISYGNSVTGRISDINQPFGGFILLKAFKKIDMNDGKILNEKENIHGTLIGLVVDYMTRYLMGTELIEAFSVSLQGAKIAQKLTKKDTIADAYNLYRKIDGLNEKSVINACKLVTFDAWKRNPFGASMSSDHTEINPDKDTVENIITMINRSLKFFEEYGPITKDGFNFGPENGNIEDYMKMIKEKKGNFGGYTPVVCTGDGDFLTKDTLWDFKVLKKNPQGKDTLQLLMYWIMGQHSGQECFKNIDKIGFFNPRANVVFIRNVDTIDKDIIEIVEKEIICYK